MWSVRFGSKALGLALLSTIPCFAQPSSGVAAKPHSRDVPATVSVQELAIPEKVRRDFNQGVTHLVNGEAEASVEHFLRTIEQSPRYFGAYHNLALAYMRLGQTDAAAQNFQKVIDLTDSSYAPSLYGLAMLLYRKNELTNSESLVRRALTLDRTAAGTYCLGTVLFALGRIDEAERYASDAIQLDPNMGDSYLLLARIHEAQQNVSATIDDIRTFFRLSPNSNMKPEALAILYRAQQSQSASSSRDSASLH